MSLYLIANGPMPTTAAQVPVTTGTAIKTLLQVKPFNIARIVELPAEAERTEEGRAMTPEQARQLIAMLADGVDPLAGLELHVLEQQIFGVDGDGGVIRDTAEAPILARLEHLADIVRGGLALAGEVGGEDDLGARPAQRRIGRAGQQAFLGGGSGAAPREWPAHLSQAYVAGWWAMHALTHQMGEGT